MSSDALFQLGMDLDHGSSTAQTEEKLSRRFAPSREEQRKDFFCERDGVVLRAPISSLISFGQNASTT